MIRSIIRRLVPSHSYQKTSKFLHTALTWPMWWAVEISDDSANIDINAYHSLAKEHRRIGAKRAIVHGRKALANPYLLSLIRILWYHRQEITLMLEEPLDDRDGLVDCVRNGVQAFSYCVTPENLVSIDQTLITLAWVKCRYPAIGAFVLFHPDLSSEHFGLLVEKAAEHGIVVLLGSHQAGALSWGQAELQLSDSQARDLNPAHLEDCLVLVNGGCSCQAPYSGWFIDSQLEIRVCEPRTSLGNSQRDYLRSRWSCHQANRQRRIPCVSLARSPKIRVIAPHSQPTWINRGNELAQHLFVSVVIPTFGRNPAMITETLCALNRQDYPSDLYEVIVVDDGNPNRAGEQAVKNLGKPGQIRCLCVPHGGAASARNHGIRAARGEIIAFTDDDCLPSPDWISEMASAFGSSQVGGVAGLTLADNLDHLIPRFLDFHGALRKSIVNPKTAGTETIPTANAAYRKSVLEQIGGFSDLFEQAQSAYGGEDRYLTWQVTHMGCKINLNLMALVLHKHRTTYQQMIKQAYHYGQGNFIHCWLVGEPYDYPPEGNTFWMMLVEYLLPYLERIKIDYMEGASFCDALLFPWLDFSRRYYQWVGAMEMSRQAKHWKRGD